MNIFLERFVLPVLATGVVAVIILNPFKLDRHQRAGLLVGVLGLAYFVGRTIQRKNQIQAGPASKPETIITAPSSGAASTAGDNSPATTGNGNTYTYGNGGKK